MSYATETVEYALDRYMVAMRARGLGADPEQVRAVTLARFAGIDRTEMSHLLQKYRRVQGPNTRYCLQGRGYGRDATWAITAKPGVDTKAIRAQRAKAAVHVARDGTKRVISDVKYELKAAGWNDAAIDRAISAEGDFMVDQMQSMVRRVERVLNGKR